MIKMNLRECPYSKCKRIYNITNLICQNWKTARDVYIGHVVLYTKFSNMENNTRMNSIK